MNLILQQKEIWIKLVYDIILNLVTDVIVVNYCLIVSSLGNYLSKLFVQYWIFLGSYLSYVIFQVSSFVVRNQVVTARKLFWANQAFVSDFSGLIINDFWALKQSLIILKWLLFDLDAVSQLVDNSLIRFDVFFNNFSFLELALIFCVNLLRYAWCVVQMIKKVFVSQLTKFEKFDHILIPKYF